ncbi:MAG: DUF4255 domain-containing protein [Candidatus Nitronauta litoralis]|uniref:DUF4255 domain-containing protein n=1 Tax=Candidatus Nitronauta litoralis TaxID=2705533 RepID=A0A7T0BXP3_9BACT|nr:MAG: DUF4255 domain-containing protein [Candidatus Nitronauta litoralis]
MATHAAMAAVSRTIRTLLLDRMVVSNPTVTIAPPDVAVTGINSGRVNLYLFQVLENAGLKNQEIPGEGHPAAYGRPPLSLNLRYLITTHSMLETQPDADLNSQTLLGDAMRVLHDFGNQIDTLTINNTNAGQIGDPILDPLLTNEFERLKIVLHPSNLDDVTKVWSALSESNFRRSVIYEATVIQIQTPQTRVRPQPVETRRIMATVRPRPVILEAFVTPAPNGPEGEGRVRIGDEITLLCENVLAERVYVQLGDLDPIRVSPSGEGRIRINIPDNQYPVDLDNPATRPIPAGQQLQPGTIEIQVLTEHPADGVEGDLLSRGTNVQENRRYSSNFALMQLTPQITGVNPANGPLATIFIVQGTRLWHNQAQTAEVIIGNAAVTIRQPGVGDPWAAPTPTEVQIPVSDVSGILTVQGAGDPPYPVAVQVDGARSRDAGFTFHLDP